MDNEDPDYLTPDQKRRERKMLTECFRLMRDERSRYERQAERFLATKFLTIENSSLTITYSIEEGRFTSKTIKKKNLADSVTSQFPIPQTKSEQIEALIEFFAQSEVAYIN